MADKKIFFDEAQKQFEVLRESPDVVIACTGGGSNFADLQLGEDLRGRHSVRLVRRIHTGSRDQQSYLEGKLQPYELPDEEIRKTAGGLKDVPSIG